MISRDDVIKAAKLAKLRLKEEEIQVYTEQLQNILHHVEKLNQLNTTNIEPTSHAVDTQAIFREDIAHPCDILEKVFEVAPDTEDRFFRVPKVI